MVIILGWGFYIFFELYKILWYVNQQGNSAQLFYNSKSGVSIPGHLEEQFSIQSYFGILIKS